MADIKKEISELYNLKNYYQNKVKSIQTKIDDLQNQIYKNCVKKNNGHKWIREKEMGPYGETFYYCELCNYEK